MSGRRRKRITIVGDVIVNETLRTKGLDVSEGGMYVFTKNPYKKGQNVKVSIPFRDSHIELSAVVQHVEKEMGMGLRFFDLNESQRKMIKDYIEYFSTRPLDRTKKQVILADSNALSRSFNRNRLSIEGFDVFPVSNGPELIEVLEEEQIDLVITDMFLDKMDAFKLLSLMKQTTQWQNIPVLVLTSSNNPEDIDRAAAAGAVEILPKLTTSPIRLMEKIRQTLKM